ncbi:hypothetical protein FQR65_LT02027 [Abscondita terminalis]|nr:hypothetical protein FQR65_LT02027 [Abscondita terminalis]
MEYCVLYVSLIALSHVQAAQILCVYPFPAYSHYQLGSAICKELAKKGHQVTVITPFKENNLPRNYSQILVDGLIEKSKSMKASLYDQIYYNVFDNVYWLDDMGLTFTELTLEESNVKKLLQEEHHFDLVIFHQFMSDAYNGFCHHFRALCIGVISTTAPSLGNRKVGNPSPPSYVPQLNVNFPANMNFFQRFYNTFVFIITEACHYLYLRPNQNKLLKKYFPNAPHLDELYYNISLLLVNSHVSITDVAPSLPNVIHIAGAHIREPQPLPSDIQKFLDDATDGVIFFSMGSNLKSKDLSSDKREAILKVFSTLKQKVLWKWEDENLPNKPNNVKISSWLPQQGILAHPNVVLFITHGGLMSTIEAVYYGVPILGIPVFSDQGLNMARAELAGYGKNIFYKHLNEYNFGTAVNEILTNTRFKENANTRSLIMKDQILKPLDNAVFWIEYVLRHQGAPHLKSAALNLTWYQYLLLDVIDKLTCAVNQDFELDIVVYHNNRQDSEYQHFGIYPFPAYSHYQLGDAIFKALAKRGHQVTVVSPFKENNPPDNYTQILVDGLVEKLQAIKVNLYDKANNGIFENVYWLDDMGLICTELTLEEPNVKKLLQEKHHFDLVIYHQFMSDAYNGFCHHFGALCIGIISTTAPSLGNRKVGNPSPPSYVPQLNVNYPANMNFFQRFYNTFVYIITEACHYLYFRPNQNKLLQKYFPDAPHLDNLYYNTSLLLVNSHVSITDVAPSLPNVIHIAGAHVPEPRPLSSDLKEFLDNAKDGAIFFSMGSNLKSEDLSNDKRDALLKVFSKLKQKVLWKWEGVNLPNKPDNVKTGSWLPQPDILAHPNVVLFITHGGLMSTIEAVYHGVPVLGIPVYSDQGLNMVRAELAGYAKYIFYNDLNEHTFGITLNELLTNPRFKENAKIRSRIMNDQVVKPLDNAVFWIEYVLRHRGAPHLKSEALNLTCEGARILGVYPFPAYSHYQLGDVIFKELAKKGHQVTVISPFKEKNPPDNFSQILVDGLLEKSKAMKASLLEQINYGIVRNVYWLDSMGLTFTELTLEEPNVQKLLQEEHHFDLVIFHQFMSDAYNGFCHHYRAPCIGVISTPAPGLGNRKVGNPNPPSYVPQLHINYPAQMNFFQRCHNTLAYVITEVSHYLFLRPNQNKLLKKYFPNAPHLDDLYYNISLLLVNSHVSITDVAPSLPNIIHIAGAHVRDPKPLPSDLKEFLDNAKDGVILFSMGSNLKSKDLSKDKLNAFLKVFSTLKQKVLWKWEDDNLSNKPDNVKISSWLPQQDILAHPNVVLFITHGGLMSTIEAVHNGVPVLGIPVFSDQGLNMVIAEQAGYAKHIFYKQLNEDNFGTVLNELLTNPSQRSNKVSDYERSDSETLDNAVFWIEYVLRHRGAPHLKSAALNLSWYQYCLLDVIGVYPFPTYSHYQLGDAIFKALVRKGHHVTVISPFKENNPPDNYTQILVDGLVEKSKAMKASLFDQSDNDIITNVYLSDKLGFTFTELALEEPNVKNFLQEKHHFDLVIFHQFTSDAYNGFCHHFRAPCIAVISTPNAGVVNRKVGNSGLPSYVPQLHVNYPAGMNFFQRCYNTFAYVITEASHYLYLRPNQNKLLQKHFPNAPHLDDLYYNNSLLLVNSHVSINDVAPSLPNVIHIGGAHVREPSPLSLDLQNFLDNSKDGVIFFSMGSNLKSKDLPRDKREAFLKVFSTLKENVLWKWEDENFPEKPDNVKIGSWLPQQDILAHPNVVLFITHGGLMSTIEAVYNGVPVLGIPVFSDQGLNMIRAELAGYAKHIFYKHLNEDNFETTIKELLSNPRFKENAMTRSQIMKDQVVKPLDNAVFWIEYVLRHRGAPHLKSASLNLTWYQYSLLDVMCCAFLILIIFIYLITLTVKTTCRLCCQQNQRKYKKKKH